MSLLAGKKRVCPSRKRDLKMLSQSNRNQGSSVGVNATSHRYRPRMSKRNIAHESERGASETGWTLEPACGYGPPLAPSPDTHCGERQGSLRMVGHLHSRHRLHSPKLEAASSSHQRIAVTKGNVTSRNCSWECCPRERWGGRRAGLRTDPNRSASASRTSTPRGGATRCYADEPVCLAFTVTSG